MGPGRARAGIILFAALALASLSAHASQDRQYEVRTPANLSVSVAADRATLESGESIRYFVTLGNSGSDDATEAWVNATFDRRLRFVNASVAVLAENSRLVWQPGVIPSGDTTASFDFVAGTILGDRTAVSLAVVAAYSSGIGRYSAATSHVVAVDGPVVLAHVEFPFAAVKPGEILTFRVTVRNVGGTPARYVWVNQTFHAALLYLTDDAPVPPEGLSEAQSWHLVDLAASIAFNVTVQVDPRAGLETAVTNFVTVAYTDGLGGGLVRAESNTVWFRIEGLGANPWLWGSFAISATMVGGTYLGYARRRLRTEEIFLIHNSGRLLAHMSKSMHVDYDPDSDIVSGMFTIIMSFVRDAFHYDGAHELQGLDLGRYRVIVRKGALTYLALMHSGRTTHHLTNSVERALSEIESRYGDMLQEWDGEVRDLGGIREILKDHFLSPTGPSKSPQWIRSIATRLDQTFKRTRPL